MIKKRYIIAIASFIYVLWTGLLINIISDVTDNFKIKQMIIPLEEELEAAEAENKADIKENTNEIISREKKCITRLFESSNALNVGVYSEVSNEVEISLAKEISTIFLNSNINATILPKEAYLEEGNVAKNSFLLGKDVLIIKYKIISERPTSELVEGEKTDLSSYISIAVLFKIELYDKSTSQLKDVCEVTEFGYATIRNEALEDAKRRFLETLSIKPVEQ